MPVLDHPAGPTHEIPGAMFTTLASPSRGTSRGCVWRLQLQPGEPPNPHRLTTEEIFVVTAGAAQGRIGDEAFSVRVGQTLVVPGDVDFEISASEAVFEALVYFPADGKGIIGDGEPFTPPWAL